MLKMQETLPKWTSSQAPLYDITKSYEQNFECGPIFDQPFPKRAPIDKTLWYNFLGFQVQSRLGVPAGPLLSSQWTTLAAKLGFDIVTYKTIRSKKHQSHPLPNMLYVDIRKENDHISAIARSKPQDSIEKLAVTNSFGMPSMDKDFLLKDIEKANQSLSSGQIMVVSVVGTPSPDTDFFQDFVEAACLAKDAGAKIIEANFSCPNVVSKEGTIYTDPEAVYQLGRMIKTAIKDTPLIIKVGCIEDLNQLRALALSASKANIDAISGINTISMQVKTPDNQPALGPERLRSGICGGPIKSYGLDFSRNLSKIIEQEKLDLTLIGVGGITTPQDFEDYFVAGAHFAQSATGMMWDPYLAMRYHNLGE